MNINDKINHVNYIPSEDVPPVVTASNPIKPSFPNNSTIRPLLAAYKI